MYDDVVRQGVPDRFAELIRKLDGPEAAAPRSTTEQKLTGRANALTSFVMDILVSVPSLRAFAISLSGNGDRADDLVQETLLRAIAHRLRPARLEPAGLAVIILRNLFRSDYRKRVR